MNWTNNFYPSKIQEENIKFTFHTIYFQRIKIQFSESMAIFEKINHVFKYIQENIFQNLRSIVLSLWDCLPLQCCAAAI